MTLFPKAKDKAGCFLTKKHGKHSWLSPIFSEEKNLIIKPPLDCTDGDFQRTANSELSTVKYAARLKKPANRPCGRLRGSIRRRLLLPPLPPPRTPPPQTPLRSQPQLPQPSQPHYHHHHSKKSNKKIQRQAPAVRHRHRDTKW